MRINKAGFVDIYDTVLTAYNRNECEQHCLNTISFLSQSLSISQTICRSYTFDAFTNKCYLSHLNQKKFGRNYLENFNTNLSSGDLENCLQCMF